MSNVCTPETPVRARMPRVRDSEGRVRLDADGDQPCFSGQHPLGMAELIQAAVAMPLVVGSFLPSELVTAEGFC